MSQSIGGIRIDCSDIRLNLNREGHSIISGEYFLHYPLMADPLLEKEAALNISKQLISQREHRTIGLDDPEEELTYKDPELLLVCPRNLTSGNLKLGYRT